MRVLETGCLVVAGAITGALVMKVWHPLPEFPAPAVLQIERPSPASQTGHSGYQHPASKLANSATRTYRVRQPAVERRAATAASEPGPAFPAPAPDPASLIAGFANGRVERGAVPGPHPEAPQESHALPPSPPARTEPEKVTPIPPPPPERHRVTLNAGTIIPVRLVDGLSTERNRPGDVFSATLVKELVADDFVIAEPGARVEGQVVACDPAGKRNGVPGLTVRLIRLDTSDGQSVAIRSEPFERQAEPAPNFAGRAAGTTVSTAIAPGARGGRDTANGPAGGPGAGVLLTRVKPATLPSKTRIPFRLESSVTLTEHTR
jgi:hypothetical protein